MNQEIELKLNSLIQIKSQLEIKEKERLKKVLNDLGYLNVYLNMYLKNTKKNDNLKNIQGYIHENLDVWLRKGHRI